MAPRKRSAPEPTEERRRSGRISSTPKKSNYFEASEDELGDSEPPRKRGRPSKKQSLAKEESEDQSEAYVDEEEDEQPEDEDEDEDEVDEDAPMKKTVIPLEQMRDTGGVEYEDPKIHQNTLLFLKDLKANNKRSWLKSHDGEYRRALKDWQSFVEATTLSIIDVDETVPELPVKDVMFRIHRDIRFSKDPTPYKPHFSAAWSRTGRKGPYACYYIHCEPKQAFIGGGLWCPEKDHLAKLRRSIDRHPARWRRALNTPEFKRVFFPQIKANAGNDKVVDAFTERNKEYSLKKRPQGYEMDHNDIKLLRLKSFTVGKKIDESMLCAENAQEQIREVIQGLEPFVSFLNNVVMPDPSLDDDSDSEAGADDQEEENGGDEDEDESS